MFCSECGSDNYSEAEFCSNCGRKIKAAITPEPGEYIPTKVASSIDQDMRFCAKCGEQMLPGERFCGKCGWSMDKTGRKAAVSIPSFINAINLSFNVGTLVSGIGAVLVLISLAVPWYTIRGNLGNLIRMSGESTNVTIGDLMDTTPPAPNWAGIALPVILIIIFASLALLAILYSTFAGTRINQILSWLGILSLLSILSNALYLLFWLHDQTSYAEYGIEGMWINIIHIGSVLVFIGAIVMIVGSRIRRDEV